MSLHHKDNASIDRGNIRVICSYAYLMAVEFMSLHHKDNVCIDRGKLWLKGKLSSTLKDKTKVLSEAITRFFNP